MAYYSLPKIKQPLPQVPLRVANNRQRFSDTLQQRQVAIDQRKQEIQTGYVLQQLLKQPLQPEPMGGLPPPVMGLGMPARLPGFAGGGEVDTGGETEDERREREAREAAGAGAAAGMFGGAGYMGGLGAFAPPPALPGAPIYGPTQPSYAENVQAMVRQNPEAVQVAAGEAQANNVEANLAQMRDYLPGNEKGPWYGPTPSPAEAMAGVQKELGPGIGGQIADTLAGPALQAANLLGSAPVLNAAAPGSILFNQGDTPWAEQARAINEPLGNAGAWLGRQQDQLPQELVRAVNPGGALLDQLGISGEKQGRFLAGNLVPETWSEAALAALGGVGSKGPIEAAIGLPIDEMVRGGMARVGAGIAERLPGIRGGVQEAAGQVYRLGIAPGALGDLPAESQLLRSLGASQVQNPAGVRILGQGEALRPGEVERYFGGRLDGPIMPGLNVTPNPDTAAVFARMAGLGQDRGLLGRAADAFRGGELGAARIPGRQANEGDTIYNALRRDIGLSLDPAKRLADQVRTGELTAEDALLQGQRMVQGVQPPAAPLPTSLSGPFPLDQAAANQQVQEIAARRAQEAASVGTRTLPRLVEDEQRLSQYLANRPNPEQLAAQMRAAVGDVRAERAAQPSSWLQDLQRRLEQSSQGVSNPRTILPQGPQLLQLPERTQARGLPDVMPMGPRSQPDVSGGFNFPTDAGGNRLGAAGLPESNSERISRYMQEAQARLEPEALPLPPRETPLPEPEPLPSERLPAGPAGVPPGGTPPGFTLPDTGLLKLNDPEKFESAQRWLANQVNTPASQLSPQEMSNRLYNAGLESIAANRRDGTFSPPQLKALVDRYNYADSRGIKLPGEEPPSGLPDAFDLARAGRTPQGSPGSVRNLSLDEAQEQADRLGVAFDREAVQRGTPLTQEQEWARLQKATDDYLYAKSPEGKAAEAAYADAIRQEAANPNAAPTPPPGGFPQDVDTPALQRAYNLIMDAAYTNLSGDWGTILRQDVMSMLNVLNVPQSLQVIQDAARMASSHAEALKVLDEFDGIIKAKNAIVGKNVELHLPDIPGVREGKGFLNREIMQSSGAGKIPVIGAYYNVTGRANAGLLYARRVREYERFVDNLPERRFVLGFGSNANSKGAMGRVAQSYADMVAVMGGRAKLGSGALADVLSKTGPLFTSLRFMMSVPERLPYLLPVNRIAQGHWEIMGPQWREAVRQHAGFAGTLAGILGAASAAGLEIDKDAGSIKHAGQTYNLTGGLSGYWNTIQKMADGDMMAGADFLRNKVGPVPQDILQVMNAFGVGEATGTEKFFQYLRPEYWDRGFTGGANRNDPFFSLSTADRLLGAVAPLWMAKTAQAYKAAEARGDNPFSSAAAIAGAEFFGANTKFSQPGALTQLRTNVRGDEALPPVIRNEEFKNLGPDGKAAVDKLAEAAAPEDFKAAKKEQEERQDPAFTKHRETTDKIEAQQAQRKTEVYELFRAGKIDGKDMRDLREVINTSAQNQKDKAASDPAFKKALEELPEKNDVNKALSAYYQIAPAFTKADGKIDWAKASAAQADFLRMVHDKDAKTANLLAFELNTKDALNNPIDRLLAAAQPTLNKYYGADRSSVEITNLRRANPGEDALLSLLGYGATKTPQGAQALVDLRAILPEGKAGAGGGRGMSAPVPAAAAAAPAPAAAPAAPAVAAGLPAPTGARLPPVAAGEFNSPTASPRQRENFIQAMKEPAAAYSASTRIPPAVFAAMGASESNWGRAPSVFGIKGVGSAGGANLATHEVYGGQKVNINDQFAAYNNLDDAFKHFIELTSHGRYADSWNHLQQTGDWQGFLRGITNAGYATDKSWPDSIISLTRHIENTYGL